MKSNKHRTLMTSSVHADISACIYPPTRGELALRLKFTTKLNQRSNSSPFTSPSWPLSLSKGSEGLKGRCPGQGGQKGPSQIATNNINNKNMKKLNKNINPIVLLAILVLIVAASCKTTKETASSEAKKTDEVKEQSIDTITSKKEDKKTYIPNGKFTKVKNEHGYYSEIIFNESNVTIVIAEHNPYNQLSFKSDSVNKQGNNVYKFSERKLAEVFEDFDTTKYDYPVSMARSNTLQSRHYVTTEENVVALTYLAIAYHNYEILGFQATILVFDSLGNHISTVENLNYYINDLEISEDGRMIALLYGYDEEDFVLQKPGVMAISAETNRVLLDIKGYNVGFFIKHNLLFIGTDTYKSGIRGQQMNILDFSKRKKYERFISNEEFSYMIDIDVNGYLFKKNGVKTRLDFNSDFNVTEL